MKSATLSLAALALALATTPAAAKRMKPDPTRLALAELQGAAGCDDKASPRRAWCVAADGWVHGTAAKLPMGKVLIGITVQRPAAATGPWDLATEPTIGLVALTVWHDGPANELRLTTLTPQHLPEVVAEVAAVLTGKKRSVKVPAELRTTLKSLAKKNGYRASKGASGWMWMGDNGSELRKVGKHWVVIEGPANGSDDRTITILTEQWK
ncbi:MAG: hypothetical protein IPL61_29590 [Myxococcales bacterium]|nr:hypothetical protein [Myxococcales bacterium]